MATPAERIIKAGNLEKYHNDAVAPVIASLLTVGNSILDLQQNKEDIIVVKTATEFEAMTVAEVAAGNFLVDGTLYIRGTQVGSSLITRIEELEQYRAINDIRLTKIEDNLGIEHVEPVQFPTGYTQIEYIESNGSAWIDTGLTINGGYELYSEICVPATYSTKITIGITGYTSQSMRQGFLVFNTGSHKVDFYWPGVSYTSLSVDTNIDLGKKVKITQDRVGITVQQDAYTSTASYSTGTTATDDTAPIYIGYTPYSSHQQYKYNKRWRDIIRLNGETLRDFVPAKRDSDDVAGYMDIVHEVFYPSIGTGNYIAGPVVLSA